MVVENVALLRLACASVNVAKLCLYGMGAQYHVGRIAECCVTDEWFGLEALPLLPGGVVAFAGPHL
jgi:hypothetical protein